MVDFPNSPVEGDLHSEEGTTWVFYQGAWVVALSIPTMLEVDLYDEGTSHTPW